MFRYSVVSLYFITYVMLYRMMWHIFQWYDRRLFSTCLIEKIYHLLEVFLRIHIESVTSLRLEDAVNALYFVLGEAVPQFLSLTAGHYIVLFSVAYHDRNGSIINEICRREKSVSIFIALIREAHELVFGSRMLLFYPVTVHVHEVNRS